MNISSQSLRGAAAQPERSTRLTPSRRIHERGVVKRIPRARPTRAIRGKRTTSLSVKVRSVGSGPATCVTTGFAMPAG